MSKPNKIKGYSAAAIFRNALTKQRGWRPLWRNPELKKSYDVVIIGAGGHGLATAYYLAIKHGIRNVAVIEKGYLGGGNSGRNTQVTRSDYFWPESSVFYDHSLRLFENLSQELNFNVMLSQRGTLSLVHSHHEMDLMRRWVNAIQLNGVDAITLDPVEIKKKEPLIKIDARYPVLGGFLQQRAGISHHNAVVWGYARAASQFGVDIIQQCELLDFIIEGEKVTGVRTSNGTIEAPRVALAVAGHTSVLTQKAGFRVPITSMALQAMVTEPIKPVLNTVTMSGQIHMYVSQSDRGELVIGGGADVYNSYAQRGGIPALEANIAAVLELFPAFRRLRLMRQWAGIVDISPDTTPIMGKTPIEGLYVDAGWGTGGYKAIPAAGDTMAYTIANDKPHPYIRAFGMDRFSKGALVDEGAAAGVEH